MTKSAKSLQISAQPEAVLSKEHIQFNKLIKQIEKKRNLLLDWQTQGLTYQQHHTQELYPIEQEFSLYLRKLVFLLDESYTQKGLSKKDKQRIKIVICDLVAKLLESTSDEALNALYEKHSGNTIEEDIQQELQEEAHIMKEILGQFMGVDIDIDQIKSDSPDEFMRNMQEQVKKAFEAHEAERKSKQKTRKKSAQAIKKEALQEQEALNIKQSIREIYRKLASELHPDREQDEHKRQEKIALMQEVNLAYQNNNLLKLLELQLQIEQIDSNIINTLSDERVRYYNKILKEQSKELSDELMAEEMRFKQRFAFPPDAPITPKNMLHHLNFKIQKTEQHVKQIQNDIIQIKSDIKILKDFLKMMAN